MFVAVVRGMRVLFAAPLDDGATYCSKGYEMFNVGEAEWRVTLV